MKDRAVERVIILIFALNLIVAVAKAVYGWWVGSLAVGSDAVHSFIDAISNIVGLFAVRYAAREPDDDHPYGHHKMEVIAAVFVGGAIAVMIGKFAWSAIEALAIDAPAPRAPALGFAVMVSTLVVNLGVAVWEARRGRELGSRFLIADAAHTGSDVLVTIAVLISMFATRAGIQWADPVAALVVAVMVSRVAWLILSSNLGVLLDRAVVSVESVQRIARATPGVLGCHRVRSRGGEGAIHLDLHLVVDGTIALAVAHQIGHAVESRLKTELPGLRDVTIHVEPDGEDEEPL